VPDPTADLLQLDQPCPHELIPLPIAPPFPGPALCRIRLPIGSGCKVRSKIIILIRSKGVGQMERPIILWASSSSPSLSQCTKLVAAPCSSVLKSWCPLPITTTVHQRATNQARSMHLPRIHRRFADIMHSKEPAG
jgi:hypothetical protein